MFADMRPPARVVASEAPEACLRSCLRDELCCAWSYRFGWCSLYGAQLIQCASGAATNGTAGGIAERCLNNRFEHKVMLRRDRNWQARVATVATWPDKSSLGAQAKYFNLVERARDGALLLFARFDLKPLLDRFETLVWPATANESTWSAATPAILFGRAADVPQGWSFSHNLGLLADGDTVDAFGGQYRARRWPEAPGILHATLDADDPASLDLKALRVSPPAVVPEPSTCYELRGDESRPRSQGCEFDGKLSAVRFRGKVLLYGRANINARSGARHVQVAAALASGAPFGPFDLVSFVHYPVGPGAPVASVASWNIYFATVHQNPIDNGASLVGMFPVLTPRDSCVALAVSVDGHAFSELECIATASRAQATGEQSDHPVDGLVVRGDHAYFYVSFDLPVAGPSGGAPRMDRYAIPLDVLADFTHQAKKQLKASQQM